MVGYSRTSSRGGRATAAWLTGSAALAGIALGGCGLRDRHYVTGTVRFPDGSPLTEGRLVIRYAGSSMLQGNAYLQSDGSFRAGEVKDGDGIRAGTVKVGVIGMELISGISGGVQEVYHCDPKYFDPETSGLVFEVPKQLRWEIVVERPPKDVLLRMAQEQQADEMPEPQPPPAP